MRTYGIGQGDWRAASYTLTPGGAVLELETPAGSAKVTSRLAGEVNILNLLAAFTAAHARGVPFADLVAAIPSLKPVPGRFQSVDAGQPFTVIVDYAHTDDALRNLTALARQMTAQRSGGRVITLFGCGGDRDRTKRPKMGQAAGEGSDFVVATSDNPRSEDPLAILAEIEPGLKASGVRYTVEPDRAAAIRLALEAAKPGDVVLIAGKGHEKEQILAGRTIPFDDAEIALSMLGELGYRWRAMKLTLAEAAMGAGAVLEAPASVANAGALVAGGYSIDSRTVAAGELFFAVRGERHDGHDFVAAALERGAVAAVVSRARVATLPDAALAAPLLIAEDPLHAHCSRWPRMCAASGAGAWWPSPARPEKPPPRKPWPRRWAQSSTCSSPRAI